MQEASIKKKPTRNQSMECGRMLAAILVLYAHIPLPGPIGTFIDCIVRFTVPMFMGISGYFSYQVGHEKLKGRFLHVLKTELLISLLYFVWGCFRTVFVDGKALMDYISPFLSAQVLTNWLLISHNPFQTHLWYLSASVLAHGALYLYVRFHDEDKEIDYRPLYFIGFVLLLFNLALGAIASGVDLSIPYRTTRNGLFFGLPMFILGIFLRQYRDRILDRFKLDKRKLIVLILPGIGFSMLEWLGRNKVELPVGVVLEIVPLMLLMTLCPTLVSPDGRIGRMINHFGSLSTYIYITHLLFHSVYNSFLRVYVEGFAGGLEPWLRPSIVLLISLGTGLIYDAILCRRKAAKKAKKV